MTDITPGNLVIADPLLADPLDLAEYDFTTGTRVQTFNIHTPYTVTRFFPQFAVLSTGEILAIGSDSNNNGAAIFKVAADGTASDFILHAALQAGSVGLQGLLVDGSDRIYYQTGINTSTLTVRRFNSDGSLDTTFTLNCDAPVAPFTTSFFGKGTDGQAIGISENGQFFYTSQTHRRAVFPDQQYSVRITEYDLVNSTHRDVKTYPTTVNTSTTRSGITFLYALGFDWGTGDLFASYTDQFQTFANPALETNRVAIDRIAVSDGSTIATYTVSGGAVANWQDDTASPGSGGSDPGGPALFMFDRLDAGHPHLWSTLVNHNRDPDTNNNAQIIRVDITTGAITRLPGWINQGSSADFAVPMAVYPGGSDVQKQIYGFVSQMF